MIQVKEFLNYQKETENIMNNWLKENNKNIEIIDIKYSVGAFPPDKAMGWESTEFSGALVVYKTK